jgi:magnesium transporter
MGMIRSLVTPPTSSEDQAFLLRRNLSQENLADAYAQGDIVWIDVVDPSDDEIDWVGRMFNLSPSVMEDLYRVDRRPSLMVYPAYIFLSLLEPNVKQSKVEGTEVHCVIGERFLFTARGTNTKSVEAAYDRAAQDNAIWQRGLGYFLYLTCQNAIDAYYPLLDRISNQLNRFEEQLMIGGADKVSRQPVYSVKQQLINLRQMIAPQREVISNLLGETRVADEDVRDLFRHLYERLLRVYDLIDAQRDLSSNVLDMMDNMESKRMVDAVNRLTIFSMIFLPLTFFAGLFELNLFDVPHPVTLPLPASTLSGIMLMLMILSAGGMYFVLQRRGLL